MKFKTLTGSVRKIIGVQKYNIDWDAPSKSKFQKSVKDFLNQYWSRHVVFEEFPIAGTRMTFDFFNANEKIAIEVQGGQHTKYVPFFHGNYKNNYLMQLKRDHQKQLDKKITKSHNKESKEPPHGRLFYFFRVEV